MPEVPESGPAGPATAVRALLVALVVLGAMVAVLIQALDQTRRTVDNLTSAPVLLAAQRDTARYVCLERLMRARIPTGSLVLDDGGATYPPLLRSHALDYQRIAEELTPGYRFVAGPVPGAYRVRFTTPGPCDGTGIAVAMVAR